MPAVVPHVMLSNEFYKRGKRE